MLTPHPFPADFDKVFDVINASTQSEAEREADKSIAMFLLALAKRDGDTHIDVSVLNCESDFPLVDNN